MKIQALQARTIRYSFSVIYALSLSAIAISPSKSQSTEYWTTNQGELQLKRKGRNNYAGTFNGNQIFGSRSSSGKFIGHWINNQANTPRCNYPISGSYHWGHVLLNFSSNSFSGLYGVCDYAPGARWNGQVKMVGSGNSGIDLTGFFRPAYNKKFTTTFGPLIFKRSNGSYNSGRYGGDYGTIAITESRWKPSPTKETQIKGTFRNKEGKRGRFVFNFESECVFRGKYWYRGDAQNKYDWHGICASGKARPKKGWGCKAATASCYAESAGLLVEEFCVKNPTVYGCPFKNR